MSDDVLTETVVYDLHHDRDKVWAFRLESENLPSVNEEVSNVRRVAGGPVAGAGTRYLVDIAFGAGSLLSSIDVVEAIRPSSIVIEMESWPIEDPARPPEPIAGTGMRAREDVAFHEIDGGTRVEILLTIWAPSGADEATRQLLREASVATITKELSGMESRLGGAS